MASVFLVGRATAWWAARGFVCQESQALEERSAAATSEAASTTATATQVTSSATVTSEATATVYLQDFAGHCCDADSQHHPCA